MCRDTIYYTNYVKSLTGRAINYKKIGFSNSRLRIFSRTVGEYEARSPGQIT